MGKMTFWPGLPSMGTTLEMLTWQFSVCHWCLEVPGGFLLLISPSATGHITGGLTMGAQQLQVLAGPTIVSKSKESRGVLGQSKNFNA
jgi:hypothetical protein